jgi:hypothetical protein
VFLFFAIFAPLIKTPVVVILLLQKQMKVKALLNIFLFLVAVGLALLILRSILRPEKFKNVYYQRSDEIRVRLTAIRAIQAVYRNEHKKYAGDIDTLVTFVNNGVVHISKISGEIPKDMSQEAAFASGLISKTWETISARDKIVETDPKVNYESLKNFEFIPYCDGKKFEIQLGKISGNTYEIPVYRIDVPICDILSNLERTLTPQNANLLSRWVSNLLFNGLTNEKQFINQYQPMWLGSLSDASTAGSWE